MGKTVKGFFSNVKKWCEEERAKRAAEAEREQAAERYAKDVKRVYDALIAQGFEDSEALEAAILAKCVRITDEEE